MKRFTRIVFCVIAIIIISILFCLTCFGEDSTSPAVIEEPQCNIEMQNNKIPVVTKYKKQASNDIIYEALSQYLNDEKIIAGIMGYFKRESEMRSDAVAGWPLRNNRSKIDFSQDFTEKVDVGLSDGSTKDYFIEQVHIHFGGYGLGQWMSKHYLEALYDFAREWGTSIGDAEMQCAFMVWSIEYQTPKLWKQIIDEDDLWIIGRKIGRLYDGTGELGSETIASHAQEYYKKYTTD